MCVLSRSSAAAAAAAVLLVIAKKWRSSNESFIFVSDPMRTTRARAASTEEWTTTACRTRSASPGIQSRSLSLCVPYEYLYYLIHMMKKTKTKKRHQIKARIWWYHYVVCTKYLVLIQYLVGSSRGVVDAATVVIRSLQTPCAGAAGSRYLPTLLHGARERIFSLRRRGNAGPESCLCPFTCQQQQQQHLRAPSLTPPLPSFLPRARS